MNKGHTYIRKLTEDQKLDVVSKYESGESIRKISSFYSLDPSSIHSLLQRRGVALRSHRQANRRCTLNESAFDAESEERNYWIGFLMADGCISVRPYSTYLSVSQAGDEGKAHIERLRSFLGSNHKIGFLKGAGYANSQGSWVLTIASKPLTESLARFGMVPAKSMTARVELLESCPHFWRGVVDGDGFVFQSSKGQPCVGIVGSQAMCKQFRQFCLTITRFRASVRPLHSIWSMRLSGSTAIPIIRHLYDDCTVALPRKLAKARELLEA